MTKNNKPSRRSDAIPPAVERQIDENLKRLYRQQLEDELPESLKSLVAQLRGKMKSESGSSR